MCALYLQIKWTDKTAFVTVFSMTVNLDATIKIVAEYTLKWQHTAVTIRRVLRDTFFPSSCMYPGVHKVPC